MRKLAGYGNYFNKQFIDLTNIISENSDKIRTKTDALLDSMNRELDRLPPPQSFGQFLGVGGNVEEAERIINQNDEATVRKHKIHDDYMRQINQLIEATWNETTNIVNIRYMQHIKPMIEAMYSDCMRNCLLISDPDVMKHMSDTINKQIYGAVTQALSNALSAYELHMIGRYPYICNCDLEEVKKGGRTAAGGIPPF